MARRDFPPIIETQPLIPEAGRARAFQEPFTLAGPSKAYRKHLTTEQPLSPLNLIGCEKRPSFTNGQRHDLTVRLGLNCWTPLGVPF
jgi:hypothetical protein